jgi:DNA-directed RNA polymerase specialized sigma24 family protein
MGQMRRAGLTVFCRIGELLGAAKRGGDRRSDDFKSESNYLKLTQSEKEPVTRCYRLSVSERREVVQELSDEGLSQRKIADVLGVDVGTVNRDIHADDPVENATVEAGNAPARQNKSSASVESSTLNC